MGESDGPTYMADSELPFGMEGPGYLALTFPAVYNYRTSNAWDMDLALTTTYFPHCGLTFAILFGCPLSVEEEIIRRLSLATAEAAHPLLLPGILVELERNRHVHVVEAMINKLETKIFELDFHTDETERTQTLSAERRNQEKRTAYLDTAYLRNGLIGWITQLLKMVQRIDDLENNIFASGDLPKADEDESINVEHSDNETDSKGWLVVRQKDDLEWGKNHMRRAGRKIKDRLQAIIYEYEDKIRDCTMRVDGMAMATQWVKPFTILKKKKLTPGPLSRLKVKPQSKLLLLLPGTRGI
jgi:hypothetical protein